jgi:hypothetical protein
VKASARSSPSRCGRASAAEVLARGEYRPARRGCTCHEARPAHRSCTLRRPAPRHELPLRPGWRHLKLVVRGRALLIGQCLQYRSRADAVLRSSSKRGG